MNKKIFVRTLFDWCVVVVLSVVCYFDVQPAIHMNTNPEKLYQQGYVYKAENSEDVLAIKVLDIDPNPIERKNNIYYLVKHEYGVTAMKVIKGSVYKLLEMKEVLAPQENPLESADFYLHVQVLPEIRKKRKKADIVIISQEFKDIIQERFNQSDLSKGGATVDTTHLLDLMEGEGVAHFLVKPVLVGLVAVFFLVNTIRRILYLCRQFKLFNTLFPGYTNQPEKLVKDADYSDKKLELLVHQGILVFYGMDFEILPVDDIEEIKLFRVHRKSFYRYKMKIIFYSSRRPYVFEINKSNMEVYYPFIDYLRSLAPIIVEDGWKMNYR
jgi:hypothetical protein